MICFCLLCFHSDGRAEFSGVAGTASGLGVSFFSGCGKSFVCPLLCERVGFYGILDGFRAADGFSGGDVKSFLGISGCIL